jgi:VWFA-related protein
MSVPRYVTCVLLVSGLSVSAASGQQPPTPAQPRRIYLDVVVAPRSGAPVAGLQKSDFTLLDDKAARPVATFDAFGGPQSPPLKIVILIDAVNADHTTLAHERQQVDSFLRSNDGHLAHPTQLAVFTDTGTKGERTFSSDGNALSAALDKADIGLRDIRRDTGFYGDAERLQLSVNELQLQITREAALPGRKIILWISPGWPYLAGAERNLDDKQERGIFDQIVALSNQLRTARITLYSIDPLGAGSSISWELYYRNFLKGVRKPSDAQLGELGLQVLAVQSGGLALNASNDITGQIEHCVTDLESYYQLSFDAPPAGRPDEYHQLDLKVDKPGLIARTHAGYYNQP